MEVAEMFVVLPVTDFQRRRVTLNFLSVGLQKATLVQGGFR
jgi:hypothetical protein